jgi:hypothetical protein
MDDVDAEGDQGGADRTISSPEKINRMTTNFDEITNVPSEGQRDIIYGMLREWAGTCGDEDLPPPLQALADRIGVATVVQEPNPLTPARERRMLRNRSSSPFKTGPPRNKLEDKRFVLSGTWPGLGGTGLTAGKEAAKELVEKHGGRVTSGFSKITNFLVIGDSPGQKRILDAHNKGIQIVTLDQVESVIINDDMAVADLAGPYPDAAIAILVENGIQVQRLPPPQDLEEGAEDTPTAKDAIGPNVGSGVSHRDG